LEPGTAVGDYIVRDLIARGGFGVVYRAEHRTLGSFAALKVLHAELATTQEAVLRFEREIQAIRRIHHPNVVQIIDVGQLDDGRPYFVMELLHGVDLDAHVRACGRLSPEEALAIMEPLCAALATAHESSIVHRDFKASNVFLSQGAGEGAGPFTAGSRSDSAARGAPCAPYAPSAPSTPSSPSPLGRVVLLDFGVAKLLDDSGPGLTTSRNMLGTPSCMAPEQITGRATDARTDIYALGALAYFMLTGELPFRDASVIVTLHMHLYARPPCPTALSPVSAAFDALVARAMAKEPSERFPSAGAFLAAFRDAVDASRGDASPDLDQGERRAVALHLDILSSADDPDNPDARLLSDIEAIPPLASDVLCARGFEIVLQTGNTMLLVAELPSDPARARERRIDAISAALRLHRALAARPGRDARVHVNLCLHEGAIEIADGVVVGGELMAIASWVPRTAHEGIVGDPSLFADLDFVTEPASATSGLVHVIEPPRHALPTG
jgi:serine/threonine-protein kinase